MTFSILTLAVTSENNVVTARQRARYIAAFLGFELQDQTRIAAAVSEIARNACRHARDGTVEFRIDGRTAPQALVIRVADRGPGIPDVRGVLQRGYGAPGDGGMGLIAARRLMDQCEIESRLGEGTMVTIKKLLPTRLTVVTAAELERLADDLAGQPVQPLQEELRLQNKELVRALNELHTRQEELLHVNRELEDTNRGVVALYAELDERAEHLRHADQMKGRFLSHMSHEFRTPLNSILALAGLLLDRADGDLTGEQERQVRYIRKGAEHLLDLVNDLLDLAKIEAGQDHVKPVAFNIEEIFGALRGMIKPLLAATSVSLVFEEPQDIPTFWTDEGKLSQILRNFLSNAVKFTERGEIRVSARCGPEADDVTITVADTGIGIKPDDQERIFQEFGQVDNPVQRHAKGTGLGLSLCRKLANLLGGTVGVESRVGVGSTFAVTIPRRYPGGQEPSPARISERPADQPSAFESRTAAGRAEHESSLAEPVDRRSVLIIDDEEAHRYLIRHWLADSRYAVLEADSGEPGLRLCRERRPSAVLLDLNMSGMSGWEVLNELAASPETSGIPVVILTSQPVTEESHTPLESLSRGILAKQGVTRDQIIRLLDQLLQGPPVAMSEPSGSLEKDHTAAAPFRTV
jgi:signal transduction histidine kinase